MGPGEERGCTSTRSFLSKFCSCNVALYIFQILSDPQLWLVSLGNAVPSGMLTAWQNLMGLNFGPLGVTDAEIGRIGFVSIGAQALVASGIALVQDKLPR